LLSASTTAEDEQLYADAIQLHDKVRKRFQALEEYINVLIALRNDVDKLEQEVEGVRNEFGTDIFTGLRTFDAQKARDLAKTFDAARMAAQREKQPFMTRLFWLFKKKRRYAELEHAGKNIGDLTSSLGIKIPQQPLSDETISHWVEFSGALDRKISEGEKVSGYFKKLGELTAAKPLEQIAAERGDLIDEMAEVSESLWEKWLRLQPKRMTQAERKMLREYASIIEMIAAKFSSGQKPDSKLLSRYHKLFPSITKILSCWAVTSLSARGRIPFEPGFFDLLVIDEASQCDIASALPLLYRAKRTVIIGDPKQLRHVTPLSKNVDEQLLSKHGLSEEGAGWAYSVNSLFDLASGLCQSDDIVVLRDHHRSHADIIGFSNKYFYEGQLRVATRYERLRHLSKDEPAVRWINVKGKVVRPTNGGAVNDIEARAVCDQIERIVLQQGYKGTVGVVSPFRAQFQRINDIFHQKQALVAREPGLEFHANTAHGFQGDERDIIVFSPVISEGMPDGGMTFLRRHPNLFNVAITRARAALIVVGDLSAVMNCGVTYLSKFAEYTQTMKADPGISKPITYGPDYPVVPNPDQVSDWEKVLYRALYESNLRPAPQYSIDKYILDFALMRGDRKLDIEVDGERYHRN
jgi:hypothetical protein